MATIELKTGPTVNSDGASTTARGGRTGETMTSDVHAKYQEAVVRGNVYSLSVSGGAATAFVGGAGGTPLLSVYNPIGSGKNLVILYVSVAGRVAASAAGTAGFNIWGGVSASNTGTATTPTNMYTLVKSGSVAIGSSNAATTSTTAISGNGPLVNVGTYYWATAAGAMVGPLHYDVAGMVVVAPGNLVAFGATAALTSATYDASIVWEEVAQ